MTKRPIDPMELSDLLDYGFDENCSAPVNSPDDEDIRLLSLGISYDDLIY